MNIVRVLELAAFALVLLLFVTQITIPLYRGRKLFPWFRKESRLLGELDAIHQAKEEKRLQERIEIEKAELKHPTKKGRK